MLIGWEVNHMAYNAATVLQGGGGIPDAEWLGQLITWCMTCPRVGWGGSPVLTGWEEEHMGVCGSPLLISWGISDAAATGDGWGIPGSGTLQRALAISKVPTVSMLAAMMGIPLYFWCELRKVNDRRRSTYAREGERR